MTANQTLGQLLGDRVAVVIGSGPSAVGDVERLRGALVALDDLPFVIAVNDAFTLPIKCHAVFAADPGWWRRHWQDVTRSQRTALRVTVDRHAVEFGELGCIASKDGLGWPGRACGPIYRGSNSGYMAAQMAISRGARRVVLLGMDCKARADGRAHFFGDHPPTLPVPPFFDLWIRDWRSLGAMAREQHFPLINCTGDPEALAGRVPTMHDLREALL